MSPKTPSVFPSLSLPLLGNALTSECGGNASAAACLLAAVEFSFLFLWVVMDCAHSVGLMCISGSAALPWPEGSLIDPRSSPLNR